MFSQSSPHFSKPYLLKLASLVFFVLLLLASGVTTASSSQPTVQQAAIVKLVPEAQYSGIPTISIVSVDPGKTVTIRTRNFPANYQFTVRMGAMFTQGIGGEIVDTFNSGAGGVMDLTFEIPAAFANADRVAIRTHTGHVNPFYSYNWFHNVASTPPEDPEEPEEPEEPNPTPVYTGFPTFTVCSVTRDSQITIVTKNMPPNQTFIATMGAYGTAGIGGTQVATVESGDGGALNVTLSVPQRLAGSHQIAVRLQTTHAVGPYYAFNWFYNKTASVC